jgi:hypothetical protein
MEWTRIGSRTRTRTVWAGPSQLLITVAVLPRVRPRALLLASDTIRRGYEAGSMKQIIDLERVSSSASPCCSGPSIVQSSSQMSRAQRSGCVEEAFHRKEKFSQLFSRGSSHEIAQFCIKQHSPRSGRLRAIMALMMHDGLWTSPESPSDTPYHTPSAHSASKEIQTRQIASIS